jgi:hypothetical protein
MTETRGAEGRLKKGLGHVAKKSAAEVNSILGHSVRSARTFFVKRVASGSTVPVEFIVQRVERRGVGAPVALITGSLKRVEEVPSTKPRLSKLVMQELEKMGTPAERELLRKAVGVNTATSRSQVPNSKGVNSQTRAFVGGMQDVPVISTFWAVVIGYGALWKTKFGEGVGDSKIRSREQLK